MLWLQGGSSWFNKTQDGERAMEIRCVYQARSALGEGALWSPEEMVLYWIDQMRPELHRLDPVTGVDVRIAIDLPDQLGGIVRRAGGGLALAASDGISLLEPDLQSRAVLVNPIAALPQASFNDAKCDRQGRLWAGTTDRKMREKVACLYRIDPNGEATAFAAGLIVSNGPSFSPDGRIIYHSATAEKTIYAGDLDPDNGHVGDFRVFAKVDVGWPDGTTVDADGCLWTTHYNGGRITRYTPAGRIDRVIEMPANNTTSCAFGGKDLGTLFVTSASMEFDDGEPVYRDDAWFDGQPLAGGVFALDVGVYGLPEPVFRA
jgi:D-xylonolactonase